ncbi:MAG: hypothetical protein JSV18_02560, partial [Candidatus Bathyarchaeota archaeon]
MIALIIRADYRAEDDSLMLKEASEICLKCGVCCVVKGHSCHVQFEEQFTPKETYVYDCLSAETPVENPNIWLCVSCHKCEELCPYEVSPISFIEAIKAKAFEERQAHPVIQSEVSNILLTGYAFPLTSASQRQRQQLGLDPPDTSSAEELR